MRRSGTWKIWPARPKAHLTNSSHLLAFCSATAQNAAVTVDSFSPPGENRQLFTAAPSRTCHGHLWTDRSKSNWLSWRALRNNTCQEVFPGSLRHQIPNRSCRVVAFQIGRCSRNAECPQKSPETVPDIKNSSHGSSGSGVLHDVHWIRSSSSLPIGLRLNWHRPVVSLRAANRD